MRIGGRAVVLGLVWAAAGCAAWRRDGRLSANPARAAGQPAVRVTRADGGRVVLRRPAVAGDSLADGASEARVALADVRRVERPGVSAGRTAALLVGVAAAVTGALFLGYLLELYPPGYE